MLVKVCGITTVADAVAVAGAGADAIGLNFWPGSPRRVSPDVAGRICAALPPGVLAVGVFVDAEPEEIESVRATVGLGVLQLHGAETPAFCARWPSELVWKAVHTLDEVGAYGCGCYLLDAAVPGRVGGTGIAVDLDLAEKAARKARVILAGGLGPGSVGEAIRRSRPHGVDVASGVEVRPGVKDIAKVAAFVRAAREAA